MIPYCFLSLFTCLKYWLVLFGLLQLIPVVLVLLVISGKFVYYKADTPKAVDSGVFFSFFMLKLKVSLSLTVCIHCLFPMFINKIDLLLKSQGENLLSQSKPICIINISK